MNAARKRSVTSNDLPGRVYPKDGAWYWFPLKRVEGRPAWIKLCRIEEGEAKMLERLSEEKRHAAEVEAGKGKGNLPKHVEDYVAWKAPKMADTSRDEWERQAEKVKTAFRDWNVEQIDSAAVHDFLADNWGDDKLHMARVMRAWLSGFFAWCIVPKRLIKQNPCKEVKLKKPKARKVYITDADFLKIRAALATGRDGKKTATGDMMQCFVDLCYLTMQRSTDVRNLEWSQIEGDIIHFLPSKTEDSSGEPVDWPVTPAIKAVLDRARKLQPIGGTFVIRDKDGNAKTAKAVRDCWNDARNRAELDAKKYTVKDIRAKAFTDAEKQGYSKEELRIAAAHTTQETTEIYLKDKQVPVSNVRLHMPALKK